MHYVSNSAESISGSEGGTPTEHPTNRREARKTATRTALITHARALTREHGLAGFTIEDLCAAADISRRSFFNHFASKDDAVLGMPKESPLATYREEFLASSSQTSLREAMLNLITSSVNGTASHDFTPFDVMELVQSEPSLMNRLRQNAFDSVTEVEQLICEREGLAYPNPYAHTVALTVHHLMMTALLPPPNGDCTVGRLASTFDSPENIRERFAERLNHLARFFSSGT